MLSHLPKARLDVESHCCEKVNRYIPSGFARAMYVSSMLRSYKKRFGIFSQVVVVLILYFSALYIKIAKRAPDFFLRKFEKYVSPMFDVARGLVA